MDAEIKNANSREEVDINIKSMTLEDLRECLRILLNQQLNNGVLDEQDVQLLSLCIGLEDGKCFTLKEISRSMNHSSEYIRQHQHFILQRKVKNPLFFLVLEEYSHYVKLPRGVFYQLRLKQNKE